MNNGSDNNAKGFPFILYLGKFKPIVFFDANIGIVRAITKDTSVCSEWHRNLYIETQRENHSEESVNLAAKH